MTQIKTPDGQAGFWVIEQKAGNVNWQDVNSLLRPGVVRLFTYQLLSGGTMGISSVRDPSADPNPSPSGVIIRLNARCAPSSGAATLGRF